MVKINGSPLAVRAGTQIQVSRCDWLHSLWACPSSSMLALLSPPAPQPGPKAWPAPSVGSHGHSVSVWRRPWKPSTVALSFCADLSWGSNWLFSSLICDQSQSLSGQQAQWYSPHLQHATFTVGNRYDIAPHMKTYPVSYNCEVLSLETIHPPIPLPFSRLPIHPSIHPCVSLSTHPPVHYLPTHLSIHQRV